MAAPTVSVIIPLHNGIRFIAETVTSVLQQTVPVYEIVVVDDGSTDHSVAAVPVSPLVRVVRRPHSGLAATLNHGVGLTGGDCVAFLDHDDRWLPAKLEKQLPCLHGEHAADLVFSLTRVFHDAPGAAPAAAGTPVNGVAKSSLLLRRATLDRIGPFPTGEGVHDFLGWYAQAAELGLRSHVVPEVLFERRIHDTNDGILNRDRQRANYFGTIRTMLERRRAKGTP